MGSLGPGSRVRCSSGREYIIEKKLAEGGMGIVYLARESSSGQRVVVKEPKLDGSTTDPIKLEKLKVEGFLLQQLNHPYIIKYIDSQDLGTNYYLVVEYIDGAISLMDKALFWYNPAPEDLAVSILAKILQALSHIHSKQIIHRDLKPDNVLVSRQGGTVNFDRPVLIDFGAAKTGFTGLDMHGHTIIGTPGWSAPEQFQGGVSIQADIYAAGAILFYLLTGEPPQNYIKQGTYRLVKSPRDINPSVSKEVSDVVLKAMQPDPAKRFQTADEMLVALGFQPMAGAVAPAGVTDFVVISGQVYPLTKDVIKIGRHRSQGGFGTVDIEIIEPGPQYYISRGPSPSGGGRWVELRRSGAEWYIVDVNTSNGVFIFRGGQWYRIPPNQPIRLYDGDLITFAYSTRKGPYITMRFKSGASGGTSSW